MSGASLKDQICEALNVVALQYTFIQSVTLTGSFAETGDPAGCSDIDCIVIVDALNADRFALLQTAFLEAVRGPLAADGIDVQINPTLGPLKLDTPGVAVLHLMIYTATGHVEHVLQSPFTCLDWQRAPWHAKQSLREVFPTFSLQPRHFFGARRSASDYLKDMLAGVVSYREIVCAEIECTEQPRTKPMGPRDRCEFAYHVVKFLMTNFLKLIERKNVAYPFSELIRRYFDAMPIGRERFEQLLPALAKMKTERLFPGNEQAYVQEVEAFVRCFEAQFRQAFETDAGKHLVFRHAATPFNGKPGKQRMFQGRMNPPIQPITDEMIAPLLDVAKGIPFRAATISPALRCLQSFQELATRVPLPEPSPDERLWEYNYGVFEGKSIAEMELQYPDIFAAWARGEDPRFPGGENTEDILKRVRDFVTSHFTASAGNTITCTHNGVIRAMVSDVLGVPRKEMFKLVSPHLGPITFLATRKWGLFVNMNYDVEKVQFQSWWPKVGDK